MNDGKCIDEIEAYHDLYLQELPKIKAIHKKCDVMITQVCPSILKKPDIREDGEEKRAAMYCFSGNNFIKSG